MAFLPWGFWERRRFRGECRLALEDAGVRRVGGQGCSQVGYSSQVGRIGARAST